MEHVNITTILIILLVILVFILPLVLSLFFRVVVPTNMVHIVQSNKKTTSYGTGKESGNVYYKWPSWFPVIGVTRIIFPVNNFNINLDSYEAYDKDRLPFILDVTAFFRIADTNKAAERVSSIDELHQQLKAIVQGAARKILASFDINQIMTDRATFGQQFTEEVKNELQSWGVEPVKNMELMDLRDAKDSNVISNIMKKKSSEIEKESRIEVANNRQAAETAEIEAQQTIDIRKQESEELVGKRTAEKDKVVGIAAQQAEQEIKTEQAKTIDKEMEVRKIEEVKTAEITKSAAIISAQQQKETTVLEAQGKLESTKLDAEGIKAQGEAKADAEKQMQMAPVEAQIALAKEIGDNEGYQQYLAIQKSIEAYTIVGTEQSKVLQAAHIKVLASGSSGNDGLKNVNDLFSAKGGLALGTMLESLAATDQGKTLLDKVFTKKESSPEINEQEKLKESE